MASVAHGRRHGVDGGVGQGARVEFGGLDILGVEEVPRLSNEPEVRRIGRWGSEPETISAHPGEEDRHHEEHRTNPAPAAPARRSNRVAGGKNLGRRLTQRAGRDGARTARRAR